jgi:hypothetical protein
VKKSLIWLFGPVGLLMIVHGCHNMAREMNEGAILYSSKCSSCHNLIEPNRFGKEKWHLYIQKYGQKMTIEQKQVLLNYLIGSTQE